MDAMLAMYAFRIKLLSVTARRIVSVDSVTPVWKS